MTNITLEKKLHIKNIKTNKLLPRLANVSISEAILTREELLWGGVTKRFPTFQVGASG